MIICSKFLTLVLLLAVSSLSGASPFVVDSVLDEVDAVPGDGSCFSTPSGVCTLRAAVMEANASSELDSITLPVGVFTLGLAGMLEDNAETGDLDIRASVVITGSGKDLTIIDAANIDRAFDVILGEAVTLQDLTIRNGSAIVAGSFAGGGVDHRSFELWLTRVRLRANQANIGGGLIVMNNAWAYLEDCSLEDNATIDAGFANTWGSAIYSEGHLSLLSSTVTLNSNQTGSYEAVCLNDCSHPYSEIVNSTIADNNTGGLYVYNCTLEVRSSTIAGNPSCGILFGMDGLDDSLTVTNSVIANNSIDCCLTSNMRTFSNTLDSDDSCGLSAAAGDLPGTNPLLLPLRNWGGATLTMYPTPGASPLIDSGADGGDCPASDQRSIERPVDGDGDLVATCDIGAVEAGDLVFYDGFEMGTTDGWSILNGESGPAGTQRTVE